MKFAINQATLIKTPMELFLDAASESGFEGVELRKDEIFEYLKDHSSKDLNDSLENNKLRCVTFNAIELFSLCSEPEFRRILEYTERLMDIGKKIARPYPSGRALAPQEWASHHSPLRAVR